MTVLIASSAARTCLGDAAGSFAALLRGESGIGDLRGFPAERLNVERGYQIRGEPEPRRRLRASGWLTDCVAEAVRLAGLDPLRQRVVALVGTGLRELAEVERFGHDSDRHDSDRLDDDRVDDGRVDDGRVDDGRVDDGPVRAETLHFAQSVRAAVPGLSTATTICNACSAAGHVLALGQDLIELGDADAVIVAGADGMTESMLAMIGRFTDPPTERVRPFDRRRSGALLGEGAAAVVLVPERHDGPPALARLLGTGLSCDAAHETAPDRAGIRRAMLDALDRSGRQPDDVDAVLAHGTGTVLNDATEAAVLAEVFAGAGPGPLVTAIKGAVGHTSGASALTSLAVGVLALRQSLVPPVVGLREPLDEGAGLRFVIGSARPARLRLLQVNAFGFGGVNSVSLVEAL